LKAAEIARKRVLLLSKFSRSTLAQIEPCEKALSFHTVQPRSSSVRKRADYCWPHDVATAIERLFLVCLAICKYSGEKYCNIVIFTSSLEGKYPSLSHRQGG
jgi:hypothetical protein